MVWKTNFDQIPYQDMLESRQQKSSTILGSTSTNSSKVDAKTDDQFDIHARPKTSNSN
jgi:hypothetical protein